MIRVRSQLIIVGCLLYVATQGIANANTKPVADELFNGTTLSFDYKGNFSNSTISVSGPGGFSVSHFQQQGTPSLDLSEADVPVDGLYKYQISVATENTVTVKNHMDNGRGSNAKTTMNVAKTQSGHFMVKDGSIVNTDISESQGGSVE